MSFNVPIQVEPGDSRAKIKGVGDELADTERKTEALSRACQRLGRNFASLGDVMERRARATEIHAQLNNHLARSFEGVTQAIMREQRMLVSIRGDMDTYQRDVQTLDALMRKGAITANEYNAALSRSRSSAGLGNPLAAVSLEVPEAKKGPGAGAALSRGAMAAGAIGFGIKEAAELGDGYTNLRNRMRQVAGSQDDLNRLMSRMSEVASNTRTDVDVTGESFVRLMMATKQLGLSQERGIKITETLNMALQSSGASTSEAAAGTLQLMQAMAAGALQGDEFRSISENIPILMEVLAKQLGVTRGELKKMGAEGKITTEIMVKALETFGPQARKTFEESEMTFGQFMTGMKNEVKEFLGGGVSVNRMYSERFGLLQKIRISELEELSAMNASSRGMTAQIERLEGLSAAYGDVALAQLKHMDNTTKLVDALVKNRQAVDETLAAYKKIRIEQTMKTAAAAYGLQDKEAAAEILRDHKAIADEARKWREEVERIAKLEPRLRNVTRAMVDPDLAASARSIELQAQPDPTARMNALGQVEIAGFFNADSEADAWNRVAEGIANATKAASPFERAMTDLSENLKQGVLQQVTRIGDELANAFMTGEFSAKKMVDSIVKDMTRLAIQQMVLFGFKSAFPGFTGSAGLDVIPRFASGGAGRVDTDSMFVGLRMTPNERLIVQTPGQQMRERESAAPSSAPAPAQPAMLFLDERALLRVFNSPTGARVLDDVLRKNPGLLKR